MDAVKRAPSDAAAWERIRGRLHELQLERGKPTFAQIGAATGLHFSTVGNAMRGYGANLPGWKALSAIWVHLGGDLAELRELHPRPGIPPSRVKSEGYLACPSCSAVLEVTLRARVGGR